MKTKPTFSCVLELVVSLIILAPLQSYNQIIYIDLDPDTTISESGGYYDINVMGDDSAEFKIIRRSGSSNNEGVDIDILKDSCYVSAIFVDCAFAKEYLFNDTIGPSSWWDSYYKQYLMAFIGASVCLHPGLFIGDTNGYLGLKWIETGITYYGWFRVDVAADATWFTVKDYAYSPLPILVGQKSFAHIIEIPFHDQFVVFESENQITVKNKDHSFIKEAQLFDMLSREFVVKINNGEIIINKDRLRPGLYILHISTGKDNCALKILMR